MQAPRDRDNELLAARHKRWLSGALFGLGAFTVVADVFSTSYAAPVWVGPLLLTLAGTVWAKAGRDALDSLARRAAPPRKDNDEDA